MDTTSTTVRDLAERYSAAWNTHDLEAVLAMHTEDSIFHLRAAGGAPIEGRTAIREVFSAFLQQLPDVQFIARSVYVGRDHIVVESTLTATVAEPLNVDGEDVGSAGRRVDVACVDVLAVRDDAIARKDTYLDSATFLQQVGG
ncbi:MAG: hypothetical protein V7607_1701 [Solirubrobacteraceae bacterium]